MPPNFEPSEKQDLGNGPATARRPIGTLRSRLTLHGFLFTSGLALVSLLVVGEARAANDWEEVERSRDESARYVLSRRPSARDGIWSYRLVTTIDGEPETVAMAAFVVLTDDRYVPAEQRRTTLDASDREVLNHILIDLPLAADREVTSRIVIEGAAADGVHRLRWREVEGAGPLPQPEAVQIPWLRGSFALAAAGSNATEVVYEMEVDLGGRLPVALVRSFLPRQMKTQVRVLREAVAELRTDEHHTHNANRS